jgi:hypothetical protein
MVGVVVSVQSDLNYSTCADQLTTKTHRRQDQKQLSSLGKDAPLGIVQRVTIRRKTVSPDMSTLLCTCVRKLISRIKSS